MLDQFLLILGTSAVTAGFSATVTVAGIKMQLRYMEKTLERHETAITRAHERIDRHEKFTGPAPFTPGNI